MNKEFPSSIPSKEHLFVYKETKSVITQRFMCTICETILEIDHDSGYVWILDRAGIFPYGWNIEMYPDKYKTCAEVCIEEIIK